MILLTALILALVVSVIVLFIGGVGTAIVFGDVIVFGLVIAFIAKLIIKKGRRS